MRIDAGKPSTEGAGEDWISLQEACVLLGVTTSTLRRWGDAGRVPMKRTLGGHRRFPRTAIEQMAGAAEPNAELAPAHPITTTGWALNEGDLARQEWHTRLTSHGESDRMRGLGQRLLGLLIQYINRREDDGRFLAEARAVGASYGREARRAGVKMEETTEAFLFFRASFSQLATPIPGVAHATDLAEVAGLRQRIDRFMDAILLGTIAGYEEAEP